jgi:hypothetical protein
MSSPSKAVVDHHVDRPGVEVERSMQLTGTNRLIGLIALICRYSQRNRKAIAWNLGPTAQPFAKQNGSQFGPVENRKHRLMRFT